MPLAAAPSELDFNDAEGAAESGVTSVGVGCWIEAGLEGLKATSSGEAEGEAELGDILRRDGS